MSKQTLAKEFDRYAEDCRTLQRELTQAIDDLEFVERGGTLCFAVDFSEIYAYALPERPLTDMWLFSDDTEEGRLTSSQRQRVMLARLFSPAHGKLVLLPSYAVELEAFLRRSREKSFRDGVRRMIQALTEVYDLASSVRQSPEFEEFARLARTQKDRSLDADEFKRLVGLFQQFAPNLITLHRRPEVTAESPEMRVRQLFRDERFMDLSEVTQQPTQEQPGIADRWFDKLQALRKRGSAQDRLIRSHLDAAAIAMVAWANEQLQARQIRLMLVSRSQNMATIFQEELAQRHWAADTVLRHPRSFNIRYRVENQTVTELKAQLRLRLETVELLLSAVNDESDLGRLKRTHVNDEILALLEQIKRDWQATEALPASFEELRQMEVGDLTASDLSAEEVAAISALIFDPQEMDAFILRSQNYLNESLQESNELLVFVKRLTVAPEKLTTLRSEPADGQYVLTTTLFALPYALQFFTDEAEQLLRQLGALQAQDRTWTWTGILQFFVEHLRPGAPLSYERLLVMAYVLGMLNQWELAQGFTERALTAGHESPETAQFEGHFFRAICRRRVSRTLGDLAEALSAIDEAIRRRELSPSEKSPDARYLKEKATIVLLMHHRFAEEADRRGVPSAEDGLKLLDEAEQYIEQPRDADLLLQIHNNRVYFRLERYRHASYLLEAERVQIEHDFETLLHRLEERYGPSAEATWPAPIIDTVWWTRWQLQGAAEPANHAPYLAGFDLALQVGRDTLTEPERSAIRGHREAVIRAGRMRADTTNPGGR